MSRTYPSWKLAYEPLPRPRRYNIFLAVVDDLRADHLSSWGYGRETSPCLDRRLATATVFPRCNSPVGWTLPGCAAIITGQSPDLHGLYDHNQRFRVPKLGHFLGEAWHRQAVTNNGNVVSDEISREYLESLGLDRRPAKWKFFHWNDGFDRYDWVARENHLRPFEIAEEFLEAPERESKPWFYFFHTNLVHDYHMDRPYYLEGAAEFLGEPVHPALRSVRDGPEVWQDPPAGLSHDEVKRQLIAKYDAGIRSTDEKLDRLFERIDFDETIVVFVSDHGEGFDPSLGRVHHCGRLHEDLTHVPLAVWLPTELRERLQPPARVDRQASTTDVVPTILTLLGDAVAGFTGQNLFDLPVHRRLEGVDRGYLYWNEDCVRESYDTARIEIRSEVEYPLKRIRVRKNDSVREYAYHLGYDPEERENLLQPARPAHGPKAPLGDEPAALGEPLTFIIAVNDEEELRNHLLSSPIARSRRHEWLFIDNSRNRHYDNISKLYVEATERAANDLCLFFHQDVYLPAGWETRFYAALRALEAKDPDWGVLGAVGVLPPVAGEKKQLRGHWTDPSGYYRLGPLPAEVQSLDEQWLGLRRSRGVGFDAELPGFHCYGIDISLTAREKGLKSWALDCHVWHKYRDERAFLIGGREESPKIRERWTPEFMASFGPCADYVEDKWRQYLPFQTTSWSWDAS